MKLLCKLGIHDWKLTASGSHEEFFEGDFLGIRTGWHGQECRRCGRRAIQKVGGVFNDRCATGPWQKAIQWQNEEITQ